MFGFFTKKRARPDPSKVATALWERLQLIDAAVRYGDFEKSRKYVEPHCTDFWLASLPLMGSGTIARWSYDDMPDLKFEFGTHELFVFGEGDFEGFSIVNSVGQGSVPPYLLMLRKGKSIEGKAATSLAKLLVAEAAKLPDFKVSQE